MHEFSLYGQVREFDQPRLLQQLTGISRMQPQHVEELHLIFKARPPAGLASLPASGEASTKQDVQRIAKMLAANIYFVQVIGEVQDVRPSSGEDVSMTNGQNIVDSTEKDIAWRFEFKDIPDAGQQVVNGRLVSRFAVEGGDVVKFMRHFGYEYVSLCAPRAKVNECLSYMNRYVVKGDRVYDQDTTLFLHRIFYAPAADESSATSWSFLLDNTDLQLFDASGAYVLHASIEATDGSIAELKDRATAQLVALRDTLKPVVALAPVDRLALDTRAPAR